MLTVFSNRQLTVGTENHQTGRPTTLPAENPDGSRTEPSGRGYFPGTWNGADVTVKDTKRYADTGGWGYYNFNHHEPKAATAKLKPQSECAFCHQLRKTMSGPNSIRCWTTEIVNEPTDSPTQGTVP